GHRACLARASAVAGAVSEGAGDDDLALAGGMVRVSRNRTPAGGKPTGVRSAARPGGDHCAFRQVLMKVLRSSPFRALALAWALQSRMRCWEALSAFSGWVI